MQAVDVRKVGDHEILFTWDDQTRSLLSNKVIRFNCGCAGCIDEMTGKRRLKMEDVPEGIRALTIETVGRYALKFHWSDGHNTGIYSYKLLKGLKEIEG